MSRISAALGAVLNPRTGTDILASRQATDIAITTEGRVRLTLFLEADDDALLARTVRHVVEAVPGVTDVRVDVKDAAARGRGVPAAPAAAGGHGHHEAKVAGASGAAGAAPAPRAGGGRVLNVIEPPRQQQRPQAPTPEVIPALGNVIAVSSGKGGVGKSTVTTNIAVALAQRGLRVGIMDADIYGPNIPRMMGVGSPPPVENQKIIPLDAHGVKLMSLGFLVERDQPAIWRGPIVMKIITQFLKDVDWGQLDFLLVDMPPGTGDAQLSLVQATMVRGAVIVTTPQEVATGDALRGARMFEKVGVPVLGVIENMSWYQCAGCGKKEFLFGEGGGARLALELSLPLLGEIPLYPAVLAGGESGIPIVVSEPESATAKAFVEVARQVAMKGASPRR